MSEYNFILSLKQQDFREFEHGFKQVKCGVGAFRTFYSDELKLGGIEVFGLPEMKNGKYVFDANDEDDARLKASSINGMMLAFLPLQSRELLEVIRPAIIREELLESERHHIAQTG